MADLYPGADDLQSKLSAPKGAGVSTTISPTTALLSKLSAPRAPGRPISVPGPAGLVKRSDVRGA